MIKVNDVRWRVDLRGVRQGEGEDGGNLHDDDVNFDGLLIGNGLREFDRLEIL